MPLLLLNLQIYIRLAGPPSEGGKCPVAPPLAGPLVELGGLFRLDVLEVGRVVEIYSTGHY